MIKNDKKAVSKWFECLQPFCVVYILLITLTDILHIRMNED